jgi:hypothetical protein
MKPRIIPWRGPLGVSKWKCFTQEFGQWGPYERCGTGYTPREAWLRWCRSGGV